MTSFAITGAAGFIANSLADRLLRDGHKVFGVDKITDYYDPSLKRERLLRLSGRRGWRFEEWDAVNVDAMLEAVSHADIVIHLAAQPGVRYALTDPDSYIRENVQALGGLLEAMRRLDHKPHLVAASSSSVYGAGSGASRETDRTAHPMSLYAATKISGEAMLHSYSHLFEIPTTVVRPFTVYGPWGRPDMALATFTQRISQRLPITLYNGGRPTRDFTYIDDVVESIVRLSEIPPGVGSEVPGDSISPIAPYRVVNIGGGRPETVSRLVSLISESLGVSDVEVAEERLGGGDVPSTCADPSLLRTLTGYCPSTPLDDGVRAYVRWASGRQ